MIVLGGFVGSLLDILYENETSSSPVRCTLINDTLSALLDDPDSELLVTPVDHEAHPLATHVNRFPIDDDDAFTRALKQKAATNYSDENSPDKSAFRVNALPSNFIDDDNKNSGFSTNNKEKDTRYVSFSKFQTNRQSQSDKDEIYKMTELQMKMEQTVERAEIIERSENEKKSLGKEIPAYYDEKLNSYWHWRELGDLTLSYEMYVLKWETDLQKELGNCITTILTKLGASAMEKVRVSSVCIIALISFISISILN